MAPLRKMVGKRNSLFPQLSPIRSLSHFLPPDFLPSSPPRIFMAEKPKAVYDESKIKTLSSLEHIRLRTGMYIGRIGSGAHPDDGCYVLLKEVVDNAIDEY